MAPYVRFDRFILILWPLSFLGMGEPTTFGSKVILMILMYGSNFLVYGMLGVVVAKILDSRHRGRAEPTDSGSLGL
jgi:hypothetical protein